MADFNRDSPSRLRLVRLRHEQTAIWYLSGPTYIGGAFGPTLPNGWELVGAADFNGDSRPDYVLYKPGTRQTAVWYLNNNVYVGGGYGPTLPPAGHWWVQRILIAMVTQIISYSIPVQATQLLAIYRELTLIGAAWGPTVPGGWAIGSHSRL